MGINLVDQNGNKTGEINREQFIRDYIDAKRAKDVKRAEEQSKKQMKEEAEAESKKLNRHVERASGVERRHVGDSTVNGLMNGIVKMLNEADVTYTQETMKSVIVYMEGKKYEIKITEKRK